MRRRETISTKSTMKRLDEQQKEAQQRLHIEGLMFKSDHRMMPQEDMDSDIEEESMGDVDEVRYDMLYTKSIVLRKKLEKLLSYGIGEKDKLVKVLESLTKGLIDLDQQISDLSRKANKESALT